MKAQLLATMLALTACTNTPASSPVPWTEEPNGRVSIYDLPVDKDDPLGVGTTTTSGVQPTTTTSTTVASQGTQTSQSLRRREAEGTDEGAGVAGRGSTFGTADRGNPQPFTVPPINTADPCGACRGRN